MGSKKDPPKAKAAKASNVYNKTNQATFGSDFGSGTSTIDKKTGQLSTLSSLSPGLQQANQTATGGLNTNLGYLARDPQTIFGDMQAGGDPYYNVLQRQTAEAQANNIANARLQGATIGNNNSTTLGSQLGRINNENVNQQNVNAVNALTFGSDQARQNVATNQNAITGLANLSYPLGAAANSNLMGALGSRNQTAQFNAAQQQEANMANYKQQLAEYNKPSWVGNAINGLYTINGAVAGGLLGGPGGAAAGANMGSSFGSGISGALGQNGGGTASMGGSGFVLPRTDFGSSALGLSGNGFMGLY